MLLPSADQVCPQTSEVGDEESAPAMMLQLETPEHHNALKPCGCRCQLTSCPLLFNLRAGLSQLWQSEELSLSTVLKFTSQAQVSHIGRPRTICRQS